MIRAGSFFVFVACLAALVRPGAASELIDRVAITVANRAITESRVLEEIRLAAFLNAEKPKLDAASRRAAADRLVERILLDREIEITGFTPAAGSNAAGITSSDLLADIRGRFLSEAAFQAAISDAKLSEAKLTRHVAEQARLLQFIDFRFRPSVTVNEADARTFYATEYPAFWLALHPKQPQPPFDEARDDVERLLVDRKVDAEMDAWLVTARAQVRIVYRDEVFQSTAVASQEAGSAK